MDVGIGLPGPLLGGAAWSVGCKVGFVERPLRDVLTAIEAWYQSLGRGWAREALGAQLLRDQMRGQ